MKLLPCPFCGGPGIVRDDGGFFVALCENGDCPAFPCVVGCKTGDEAAETWNKRVPYVHGEAVPVADILAEIKHIRENGLSLAKFGGENADEGRCRELCALYLREFIVSKRWGDELRKLDAAEGISVSGDSDG